MQCFDPQEMTSEYQQLQEPTPLPPPIMIVCIMEDTNINTVINQALKLAATRSRMPFLPKQRGRHLLALPRHSQSMSKVLPLFDTAVCCRCRCRCRRAHGAEEERSHVRKCIHNTDTPLVFWVFFPFFMASCALW